MAAPVVQSLDKILATLEPAYKSSRGLFNQQIQALPGQEQAAVQGLDYAKTNAFSDINTQANAKGLAFSGIPSGEQARYLGEKYLPAVAEVKGNTQKQQFTLQQALASLEADKYKTGLGTREHQQDTLNTYLSAERDRAFQASQAAKERAFKATEAARDRNFTASQNAANRAAQASSAVQKGAPAGLVSGVYKLLNSKKGRDGFVSPGTFRSGMSKWVAAGGSPDSYLDTYSAFVNPVHQKRWGGYY